MGIILAGIIIIGGCAPMVDPAGLAADYEKMGGGPGAEGVKTGSVPEYLVRYEGNYGNLLPVDTGSAERQIYLSDFPIDLNFAVSLDLEFTLATPDDSLYRLGAVDDLEKMAAARDEGARTGEFIDIDGYNLAGCRVPSDLKTPENVYCGFQFVKDSCVYVILVYATTERDLSNPDAEPTRINLSSQ